ncbi:hypothetical protein Tco_0612451 [Tanacetum coccineum]
MFLVYVDGFVFALPVWIFESFKRCNCWWSKDPNVIPRAVGWSKKSIFNRSDYGYLFVKQSTTTSEIRPSKAEYESSWWIRSQLFFRQHVPKAPVAQHHSMYETYLAKLEKSRRRVHSSFRTSSGVLTTLFSTPKKWIRDQVISQLNLRVFKLETIIQVLVRERKNEYGVYLVERNYDCVWIAEDRYAFDIQRFISREGNIKCKFPWSDDYTVGRNFWLTLVCLDPTRKGWLSEEHIDLWVDYKWHGRPDNANWAMVNCYFVKILMQNSTPLFYANGDKYATP